MHSGILRFTVQTIKLVLPLEDGYRKSILMFIKTSQMVKLFITVAYQFTFETFTALLKNN